MHQLQLLVQSPIHVPPVQRVLKHCGTHKHIYINIYIHTHVIQNNLSRTPQLVGFAHQLGYKKALDGIMNSCYHKKYVSAGYLYNKNKFG